MTPQMRRQSVPVIHPTGGRRAYAPTRLSLSASFDFLRAAVFFFRIPFAAAWSIFFTVMLKASDATALSPAAAAASNFLICVLSADLIIWFRNVFVSITFTLFFADLIFGNLFTSTHSIKLLNIVYHKQKQNARKILKFLIFFSLHAVVLFFLRQILGKDFNICVSDADTSDVAERDDRLLRVPYAHAVEGAHGNVLIRDAANLADQKHSFLTALALHSDDRFLFL